MTNYNTELQDLREKLARKAKVQTMLKSLQAQLESLRAEEQRLSVLRSQEQADVDRLEKPSLSAFIYAALNRKEEKLEKEKAEAYAAALKHETAKRQAEAVQRDISALQAELSSLEGVQGRYATVFAEKMAVVKAANPMQAAEICRIEDKLGENRAQVKEIDEALAVGKSALAKIDSIEDALRSAAGWGTWDLLGGGLISDLAKHSHLDDAQAQIETLQAILRRYRTELADVTVHADIQAQVEGFLRFADYFFDGLFADWAVLNNIRDAQAQVASTRAQVQNVQSRLDRMKSGLAADSNKLKNDLNDLVIQA